MHAATCCVLTEYRGMLRDAHKILRDAERCSQYATRHILGASTNSSTPCLGQSPKIASVLPNIRSRDGPCTPLSIHIRAVCTEASRGCDALLLMLSV